VSLWSEEQDWDKVETTPCRCTATGSIVFSRNWTAYRAVKKISKNIFEWFFLWETKKLLQSGWTIYLFNRGG